MDLVPRLISSETVTTPYASAPQPITFSEYDASPPMPPSIDLQDYPCGTGGTPLLQRSASGPLGHAKLSREQPSPAEAGGQVDGWFPPPVEGEERGGVPCETSTFLLQLLEDLLQLLSRDFFPV